MSVSDQAPGKNVHPQGLYLLFLTEMWERFSYYGMRAILTLYMTKALLLDKQFASLIYGNYTGLVYLTPLIGGYVSDRYWGNRRSIFVGGVIMAVGQFLLFTSGLFYNNVQLAAPFFGAGLLALIIGNGFFKPNISSMVGQLYPPGDKRIDSAFTIFYMGINMGAFFSPLVCGTLGDTGDPADFKWGFLAAGIGMVISIITFELYKNKYIVSPDGKPVGVKPDTPKNVAIDNSSNTASKMSSSQMVLWVIVSIVLFAVFFGYFDAGIVGSGIYTCTIIAPLLIVTDKTLTREELERIIVIYVAAFFVIAFWAAFEQAGASLTFFAEEQTNRDLFGYNIPASYFQSINPVAIIILAPVFAWIWTMLGKRNLEPASPLKQAIGLFLLAVGYVIIALGVKGVAPGVKVSMLWLISMYTVHTMGELALSPIGLAMVNKLAPLRFASLLMGVWFLSTAAANNLAGVLSSLYPEPGKPAPIILGIEINDLYTFFMVFVFMSGGSAFFLFLLSSKLKQMMHGRG